HHLILSAYTTTLSLNDPVNGFSTPPQVTSANLGGPSTLNTSAIGTSRLSYWTMPVTCQVCLPSPVYTSITSSICMSTNTENGPVPCRRVPTCAANTAVPGSPGRTLV